MTRSHFVLTVSRDDTAEPPPPPRHSVSEQSPNNRRFHFETGQGATADTPVYRRASTMHPRLRSVDGKPRWLRRCSCQQEAIPILPFRRPRATPTSGIRDPRMIAKSVAVGEEQRVEIDRRGISSPAESSTWTRVREMDCDTSQCSLLEAMSSGIP